VQGWLSWARTRPRLAGALVGLFIGGLSLGLSAILAAIGSRSLELREYVRPLAYGLIGFFVVRAFLKPPSKVIDDHPDILVVLSETSSLRDRRDIATAIVAGGAHARFESEATTRRRLERAQAAAGRADFDPASGAFSCFRVWWIDAHAPDLPERLRGMDGVEDVVRLDHPSAPSTEIAHGPTDVDYNDAGTVDLSVRGWRPNRRS
jgi:hypothetical protein